jgi:hypothetical protein
VLTGACCHVWEVADHWGQCSGDWTLGMISDRVLVPKGLPPGKYVVGWRMDCEETAQVSADSRRRRRAHAASAPHLTHGACAARGCCRRYSHRCAARRARAARGCCRRYSHR